MSNSVYVKIQIGADLRRVQLKKDVDLAAFKTYVWSLHQSTASSESSLKSMTIKYRDAEGDLVTLGSTEELQLFVDDVLQKKEVQPRLIVTFDQIGAGASSTSSAPAVTVEAASETSATETPRTTPPPPPPLPPAQVIANALSDAEAVRCLQNAVASPVINDAVMQVAQGFASGGPFGAWAAVTAAVPMARAVLDEAVDGNRTLCEARQKLAEAGVDVNDLGSCMNFAGRGFGCHRGPHHGSHHGPHHGGPHHGGPHHGPHHGHHGGPHHGGPHHHGAHHQHGFHPWVVCDGCSNRNELKDQSVVEGFHTPRGWIAGPRFKSLTVDDFDLCQSCMNSGKFNESHGPFETLTRDARRGWGGRGGGCGRPPAPHAPPPSCRPTPRCAPDASSPHHHQHSSGNAGTGPGNWGGMPFFEWVRHQHQQNTQPQHQARGCRGSRRDLFANIFRDVVAQGASTFEQVAKENDNEELASLARAFSESFRATNNSTTAAASTSASNPTPQQAKEEKKESAPESTSTKEAVDGPSPVSEERNEDDEWEVPDVTPTESEDPFVKWQAALQQLALLGFTESENYIEFLEEEDGDLEHVVNRIVRRAA